MTRSGVTPWPADTARRYVAAGYWRQRPLGSYPWDWADRFGERIAIVDGEVRLTYRELARRTDALAEALGAAGIATGENVLVQMPNCWELVVLVLACARAGVGPVLALTPHREYELTHLADLAAVTAFVVPDVHRGFDHQELANRLAARPGRPMKVLVVGDDVRPGNVDLRALATRATEQATTRRLLDDAAPDPEDVALYLLSGGTTGLPKIIARTHNDYEYNARRSGEVCGFNEDTVYLAALPVAHNFALGSPGVLGALMAGGRVVLLPSPSPDAAFAAIARERVTVTAVVPAVARRWVGAARSTAHDFASLDIVQVGGSVLAPEQARDIVAGLGCRLQQVFGMAEGLLNYTRLDDPPEVVLETQGRPICPDDEVLVVGPDDRPVPAGGSGHLLTRGPYTPRGYFRAPEHNAVTFTADGWYRTGDIVRVHPSGNLVVEGRCKDLINRGGEKIAAAELEDLVRGVPAVLDAAAIAVPHEELGECPCVAVVLLPGHRLTLDDVHEALLARGVARFKLPTELLVLPGLPKTPIGKLDKRALRELVLRRRAGEGTRAIRAVDGPGMRRSTTVR